MRANGCVFPERFPVPPAGVRSAFRRASADSISYIRIAGRTHGGTGERPESHSSKTSGETPKAVENEAFVSPARSSRTRTTWALAGAGPDAENLQCNPWSASSS